MVGKAEIVKSPDPVVGDNRTVVRAAGAPHLPGPPLPPRTRPPGERRETTKARISYFFLIFPTPSLPAGGCEVGERGQGGVRGSTARTTFPPSLSVGSE